MVNSSLVRRRHCKKSSRLSICKIVIESSNKTKAEQGVLWRSMKERRRYSRYHNAWKSNRAGPLTPIIAEIKYSFLGDLSPLQFGVAFGIMQVIINRI